MCMSYEEGDEVVFHDEHSEFDGDVGTVTQKMETMFGDATYTVNFEEGQEVGVAADQLDATAEPDDTDDEQTETEAEAGADTRE